MAFYVKIRKVAEGHRVVRYSFQGGGPELGLLEINRENGEVSLVNSLADDHHNRMFDRAAVKLIRAWKAGVLPDETEWAS